MNLQQLKLYKLLGEGRTKSEPDKRGYDFIEVPDEPTIADLHRWLTDNGYLWTQWLKILVANDKSWTDYRIYYNSSLPLLDQTTEVHDAIISLIDNHK